MKNLLLVVFALGLLLAACTPPGLSPGSGTVVVGTAIAVTILPEDGNSTEDPLTTSGPPTPIPSLPSGLSPSQLKYAVLEEFPDFFYCDPDLYPVAHADETSLALERFPEIQANTEEFEAILTSNGLAGQADFTDEQKLLIYREHKKLASIIFEPAGDHYQFQIRTQSQDQMGHTIKAIIDGEGNISIREVTPGIVDCPICLAAATRIDTPNGPVAVEDLKAGDMVWTVDATGIRIPTPILKVGSVPTPLDHEMIHIILEDDREVWASPGHPTADGRVFGDLITGDLLDGSLIRSVERVAYGGSFTYDLLPSGATGFYWANGILVGSTLSSQ